MDKSFNRLQRQSDADDVIRAGPIYIQTFRVSATRRSTIQWDFEFRLQWSGCMEKFDRLWLWFVNFGPARIRAPASRQVWSTKTRVFIEHEVPRSRSITRESLIRSVEINCLVLVGHVVLNRQFKDRRPSLVPRWRQTSEDNRDIEQNIESVADEWCVSQCSASHISQDKVAPSWGGGFVDRSTHNAAEVQKKTWCQENWSVLCRIVWRYIWHCWSCSFSGNGVNISTRSVHKPSSYWQWLVVFRPKQRLSFWLFATTWRRWFICE